MPTTENQEDESAEKAFYSELDKKNIKRSCCTCQTMVIFFAVLLILLIILTVYLYREIKKVNVSVRSVFPTEATKENFNKKLADISSPTFSITITADELTNITSAGLKNLTFEIQNVQFEINEKNVITYGKLSKPLKSDIQIESRPKIAAGKIFFQVERVTAGKLVLPGFLNSEIQKAINNLMDENFQGLYQNYQVENISLENNQMIISGKLKNK